MAVKFQKRWVSGLLEAGFPAIEGSLTHSCFFQGTLEVAGFFPDLKKPLALGGRRSWIANSSFHDNRV